MRPVISRTGLAILVMMMLTLPSLAQQQPEPARSIAGQASQPDNANPTMTAQPGASAAQSVPAALAVQPDTSGGNTPLSTATKPETTAAADNDDNPYDPLLETPPLPKGKPTLIGGTATHVDHVRNRLTIQPFGGGPKVKLIVDERSHIYRNGAETTVLGIQKGRPRLCRHHARR